MMPTGNSTTPARRIARVPACAIALLAVALLAVALSACRESASENAPIHPNPNMDRQEKYLPQHESAFFADGAAMQAPPEHAVAEGALREDGVMHRGRLADSSFAPSPVEATPALLARGRERYGIYCMPCHGELGNGRGVIMKYQYPIPPTSYFDPRILAMQDGNIFEVVGNGVRTMPSYRQQIPVADRWAVVAHVRRLQAAPPPDSLKGIVPSTPTATAR